MAKAMSPELERLAYERWKTAQHDHRPWTREDRETPLAVAIYGEEGACRCPRCVYRRVVSAFNAHLGEIHAGGSTGPV